MLEQDLGTKQRPYKNMHNASSTAGTGASVRQVCSQQSGHPGLCIRLADQSAIKNETIHSLPQNLGANRASWQALVR
jgi:hypothetical protein